MNGARVVRRTLILVLLSILGITAFAQGNAALSGTVREKGGEVLPGVTIALQNVNGGPPLTAQSDAQGKYSIKGIPPGRYRLAVSLDGYIPSKGTVQFTSDQSSTQDVSLEPTSFFENVTVTPQKREQQILDVPASITAVTGGSVEKQGVTNIKDIAATVPSLSITEDGPGHQRAQIRGISSPLGLPTVGVYLDEAPINIDAAGSGTDVKMLDLDRVEVLRGPQGTLYGEGSMGGTIKYVTKDPNPNALDFRFDSAYGTVANGTSTYRGSIVANLPVVAGKFGIRILAADEHAPGWVDYPALGKKDVNDGESKTLRAKALWIAADTFTVSLMLQNQDSKFNGQNYMDVDGTAPFVVDQPVQTKAENGNLVLNWDAGPFTLLSSTGYMDRKDTSTYDYSWVFGTYPYAATAWNGYGNATVWSQEIRLASKSKGKLTWTAGAYYRDYKSDGGGTTVMTPDLFGAPYAYVSNQTSKQSALFGELNYAFSDRFSATLGTRYFEDKRELQTTATYFGPTVVGPTNSGKFTSTDPKLVLSFRPGTDTLVYASAAKGFRSGGFNDGLPPQCTLPTNYDPETLWTYELGSSASMADGHFVIQGALYHNDWTDIQTLTLCPGIPIRATGNIGKAEGNGIDLALTITPVRAVRITLSGNKNNSHYVGTALAHNDGDQIDFAPQYNYGVGLDWNFRLGKSLPGLFHADYQKTGPFPINFGAYGASIQSDPVSLVNARVGVNLGKFEVSLFGQNLTDENAATYPENDFGGQPAAMRPQPRTYGVGLGWKY